MSAFPTAGASEAIDVPSDQSLERLARIAARALRAPVALLSVVYGDGRRLAGAAGWPAAHRDRLSSCACVVVDAVSVADVRRSSSSESCARLAEVGFVAYAGVAVKTASGSLLGGFCVFDTQPRDWTSDELATLEDMAAMASSELALRETTQRYRALVEEAPLCTYRQLASGEELTYIGPQIEAFTGFTSGEWSDALFREQLHPEDRDRVLAEVSRCRLEAREFSMVYRFVARDGHVAWLVDKTVPIRDDAGRIAFRQGFLLDVTGEKEAEAALRVREAQLLQTQKLEAIGNLAGGVAHDFNNILLVIRGYCDLLQTDLRGTPEVEHVREIDVAAKRGANLVRQLLAYGRRQRLEPVRANLNDLVAGTLTFLERLIGEDIELRTSLDPDAPPICVDPSRVEEAIVNLVANARDAMPTGGSLEIGTRTMNLAAGDEKLGLRRGRYVVLSVADTGVGMDDATARQVFDPFFTTKPEGRGTGLGLAMVYGFAAQSDGAVAVETAPGRGTTFTLYFPVVVGAADRRPEPSSSDAPAGGRERILLVEDQESVRRVIGDLLRRTGYEVVGASHPAEALELLANRAVTVDLVVTDVVMPQMSGVELAKRARELRPDIPVLLMSGYGSSSVGEIHEVRHHLLEKPFGSTELAAAVRGTLATAAGPVSPARQAVPRRR